MPTLGKDLGMRSLKYSLEQLPSIPTLRTLRQEDYFELEARLRYT